MEAAIKSVLPVYAAGLWMYTGKILMPFPTNKDHQSPALAGVGGVQILQWQQECV